MGTMLQAAGLPVGMNPMLWNLTAPEKVAGVHRQYVEAGSQLLYTNTFGANRLKLEGEAEVEEVVRAAIGAARLAAEGTDVKIALDIGPIGQLLEPLGTLGFDEAYDIFREIAVAGAEAGADLAVIETMSDLYEVKAAVLAIKENTDLPVWVTMTFEASGRTFLGVSVPAMALTLEGLGVEALGFNCSLGPKQLMPMVEELRRWTDLPLILKPNAGLPDPETGAYTITPAEFAQEMREAAQLGVQYVGGCCGTNPAFIAALKQELAGLT
ncbi:MAG: homocysteine S-methyltransferase family protein, partial [Oscillospiraceae bacterium]|nr:homocysteine S-methyltransferase family protein [Oscillospiraceae bacterium]